MTYLEVVNKVLKKLREDQVTSVDYNDYSALIGEFVNDAKKEVENAWNWEILKTSDTFTGNGTDRAFTLTNIVADDARLAYDECNRPLVFDTTANDEMQLHEVGNDAIIRRFYIDSDSQLTLDKPCDFSVSYNGSNWVITFEGYPASGRTYRAFFYQPQDELEDDNDNLSVPWRPVYHLALLFSLDERGEEIGEPGSKAWKRFDTSLADSIALDSLRNTHKTQFTVP